MSNVFFGIYKVIGDVSQFIYVGSEDECKNVLGWMEDGDSPLFMRELCGEPDEIWAIRAEVARANGEPEPVLFEEDTLIGPTSSEDESLEQMLDVQEGMAKTMETIELNSKARQEAWDKLKAANDKWKGWINNPNTHKRFNKNQIREVWYRYNQVKRQLETMAWDVTNFVRDCWAHWNELKSTSDGIAATDPSVWERYFQLKDFELNRYMVSGDTEDVDEYQLMTRDSYDLMNLLWETHNIEMKDYDRPESRGVGFWSFGQEYKTRGKVILSSVEMEDINDQLALFDQMVA